MQDDLPDWLRPAADASTAGARHLAVLRRLLERDYLTRADWSWALQDLAQMARDALHPATALVATWDSATSQWSAVTSDGRRLDAGAISVEASLSVLERIRAAGQPILSTEAQPLQVDSESVRSLDVESVLAVPLRFWEVTGQRQEPRLGGCLYAHRTSANAPFTEGDVQIMLDITRIAQPNLNLLRHLGRLETDLEVSRRELRELRASAASQWALGRYETRDPWFARNVLEPLRRVSDAERVSLLLLGPTGSGKSHLAQAYHYECPRKAGAFVTLDCSQVTSAETLAAELFGYAPSSGYSNAPPKGRPGKAQLAHGGTLFIDEVGALPSELQQRLLRLLQSGAYSPLGSSEELHADLQVIAASNEDLRELVRQRRFREDLFWRISEITVHLPPLDRRPADIPCLARQFLAAARTRYGRHSVEELTDDALSALLRHDWSQAGNIRGLEHTVNRTVLLAPPKTHKLEAAHLRFEEDFVDGRERRVATSPAPTSGPGRRPPRRKMPEERKAELRRLLEQKISESQGKIAAMALDPEITEAFGYAKGVMPDSTLGVWIRDLGLEERLDAERQRRREGTDLEAIRASVRQHGSGAAAARALGMTRDTLVWRLRKAGLTIDDVLT
jgi:transcriptional regulator with GAF, ATPase, and Fis domain